MEKCLSVELGNRLNNALNNIRWTMWARGVRMGAEWTPAGYCAKECLLIEELESYKPDLGGDWWLWGCDKLLDEIEAELEIGEWLSE